MSADALMSCGVKLIDPDSPSSAPGRWSARGEKRGCRKGEEAQECASPVRGEWRQRTYFCLVDASACGKVIQCISGRRRRAVDEARLHCVQRLRGGSSLFLQQSANALLETSSFPLPVLFDAIRGRFLEQSSRGASFVLVFALVPTFQRLLQVGLSLREKWPSAVKCHGWMHGKALLASKTDWLPHCVQKGLGVFG